MVANATKSVKVKPKPGDETGYADSPLHYALKAFVKNCSVTDTGVKNYTDTNGADLDGLAEYLGSLSKGRLPAAGYQEGFAATIAALKANEAITQGQRIAYQKEWFDI